MNPSVPFLARMAVKDVKIPLDICNNNGKEYIFRKGDFVIVHTYSYGEIQIYGKINHDIIQSNTSTN